MNAPCMRITITRIGPAGISLALRGEIDADTAAEVSRHLEALGSAQAHLRIDLSETTYIDLHGARSLIAAAVNAEARGGQVEITAWSPAAERLRDAVLGVLAQRDSARPAPAA